MGTIRSEAGPSLDRIAYTITEFCFRNSISRPTYHRLRSQGLGPTEMRIGLNLIRISSDSEREWQRRLQKPQPDSEARALERAVKAGSAAVKSSKHISKARRGRRRPPPPSGTGVRDE